MSRKSESCFGSRTSGPLMEYDSEFDAREAAEYANSRYRRNLAPYRCDRCGMWHLAPGSRNTPSRPCGYCTGRDGQPKESYRSREAAAARAEILRKEEGASLQVYACQYGDGWHLTGSRRRR